MDSSFADTVFYAVKIQKDWTDYLVPVLGFIPPTVAAWVAYHLSIRKEARVRRMELIDALLFIKSQFEANREILNLMSNALLNKIDITSPHCRLAVSDLSFVIARLNDYDLLGKILELQNLHRTINSRWENLDNNKLEGWMEREKSACDSVMKMTMATISAMNNYIRKHANKIWQDKIEVRLT